MPTIRPITFKAASDFVTKHHRHNKKPRGHKFSLCVRGDRGTLLGVAMVGRPVARNFDDGLTAEINRTCRRGLSKIVTDRKGARHADAIGSMLYGACRRAAKAMGYTRLITYTLASESGVSLRAAGFRVAAVLPPRPGWDKASKKRRCQDHGTGGVTRILWEVRFGESDNRDGHTGARA